MLLVFSLEPSGIGIVASLSLLLSSSLVVGGNLVICSKGVAFMFPFAI
jgi:hypothetical protein